MQTANSDASTSQTSSVHEQHYPSQHYPNQMYPSQGNQYYPGSQYYPSQYGMTRSAEKSTDDKNAGRFSTICLHSPKFYNNFNDDLYFTEKTVEVTV